jgi:hypothetical protein
MTPSMIQKSGKGPFEAGPFYFCSKSGILVALNVFIESFKVKNRGAKMKKGSEPATIVDLLRTQNF